jgi:hypothetical protein
MALSASTVLGILAGVSAASGLATTGAALAKGGPKLPKVPRPTPPPAVPPPPAPPPPAPTMTEADAGVDRERRRRQTRYGVSSTILSSPLGSGTTSPLTGGRTLLGG